MSGVHESENPNFMGKAKPKPKPIYFTPLRYYPSSDHIIITIKSNQTLDPTSIRSSDDKL